jgi:hypothetical protein
MQPDNQQFSSDYLNQIATPAPVKTVNPLALWGLIGGLLVLVIVVVVFVSSAAGGGTSTSSLTSVGAKIDNLKTVSESAQKNIQSGELRSLNGNLTLILTNADRDMAEPLAAKKIKLTDKKNSAVAKVTSDFDALNSRLEDARLNAVYDRTYAREITYALKTLHSDMSILYKSSSNTKLKTVLNTTDDNLKPLVEGFSSFNAS